MAEELALHQGLGQRRAVDRDERPAAAGAALVQSAGDELFAGAALAEDQHREIGVGDATDTREELDHDRTLADDAGERRRGLPLGAQQPHLLLQLPVLERALQHPAQNFEVDRLGDEVAGAGAQGGDRGVHAAESGHHHHRHVGTVLAEPPAELDAAHSLHFEIGQHDVDLALFQSSQGVLGPGKRGGGEAILSQLIDDHVAHARIVVDDEDLAALAHAALSSFAGR
jgi:hypothetical protein